MQGMAPSKHGMYRHRREKVSAVVEEVYLLVLR
jgi:hypothetical protein